MIGRNTRTTNPSNFESNSLHRALTYKRSQEDAPRPATHTHTHTHRGRGNTQEARELRASYHDTQNTLLADVSDTPSWTTICNVTTKAATQVFGATARPPPAPGL